MIGVLHVHLFNSDGDCVGDTPSKRKDNDKANRRREVAFKTFEDDVGKWRIVKVLFKYCSNRKSIFRKEEPFGDPLGYVSEGVACQAIWNWINPRPAIYVPDDEDD